MPAIQVLHHHDLLQNPRLISLVHGINQQPIWKRLKQLNSISQSNPYPRHLYKYRPLSSSNLEEHTTQLRDYLVESKLWLSSPSAFNDPFDMRGSFIFEGTPQSKRKHLLSKVRKYRPDLNKTQIELEVSEILGGGSFAKSLDSTHETLRKRIGVCSFAGNVRNILMWAHYASNHSGVCMQFQIAEDISVFSRATPVEYKDEYPVVNYFDDIQKAIIPTLFRKSNEWRYEGERRIVHPYGANCFLAFQPSALTGLILGCQLVEPAENSIKQLLVERHEIGLPPIKVYRACLHDTKYHLCLVRQRGWP